MANPAGIQVAGGGFINAAGVTITTGVPQLTNGALSGFQVRDGMVTVSGSGLDTKEADYTRILAKAAKLDGGVFAKDLKVVAGSNDIDANGTNTALANDKASTNTVAIDTASLGGMYAGKITVISTDKGVGVNNAGQIFASAGGVSIDANGQLINSGSIVASDEKTNAPNQAQVNLNTSTINNTGSISSQGKASITSQAINNQGLLSSSNELNIRNSSNLQNNGTISAARLDINTQDLHNVNGTIKQTGSQALAIDTQVLSNTQGALVGVVQKADSTTSTTDTITAPASLDATNTDAPSSASSNGVAQPVSISVAQALADGAITVANISSNSNATIAGNGEVTLAVHQAFDNQANVSVKSLSVQGTRFSNNGTISADKVDINAATLSNNQGNISAKNSLNIQAQAMSNTQGSLTTNGTIALDAQTLTNQDGQINAAQNLQLTVAKSVDNNRGKLIAGNNVTIGDGQITGAHTLVVNSAQGNIQADNNILLDAQQFNASGTLQAGRDVQIRTQKGLSLLANGNQVTNVSAINNITLNAGGSVINNATVNAGKQLSLDAQSLQNEAKGQLLSSGQTQLTINGDVSNQGVIASNGETLVNASGNISNANRIESAKNLNIQAAKLDNQVGGQLLSQTQTAVVVSGHVDNSGVIDSNGFVNVTADSISNQGKLSSQSNMQLAGTTLENTNSGTILANRNLTLTGNDATIAGNVGVGGDLVATVRGSLVHQAQTTVVGNATIVSQGLFTNSGKFQSNKVLSIKAASLDNQASAALFGLEQTSLVANVGDVNNSGTISSNANTSIRAQKNIGNSGTITASSGLSLVSAAVVNRGGTIAANGKVTAQSQHLDNQGGEINASVVNLNVSQSIDNTQGGKLLSDTDLTLGDSTLTSANRQLSVQNTDGTLYAGQDLAIYAKNAQVEGTFEASRDLTLDSLDAININHNITAGRDLTIRSVNGISNNAITHANNNLTVAGSSVDNQVTGNFSGENQALIQATNGDLTNRGVINSNGLTKVSASNTVNNSGTGKIYGNHVAIAANQLVNQEEVQADGSNTSAVIAARERLDIGVNSLINKEGALIYSAGDMLIGSSLDGQNQAQGTATEVRNGSATIEALGNVNMSAATVYNTNNHFSLKREQVGPTQHFDVIIPDYDPSQEWDASLFLESTKTSYREYNWKQLGSGNTQFGKTQIQPVYGYPYQTSEDGGFSEPSLFGRGYKPETLIYAVDDPVWANFGVAPPSQTIPAEMLNVPEKPVQKFCSTSSSDSCVSETSDEFAYRLKQYNKALEEYHAKYDQYQEAYDRYIELNNKIIDYNRTQHARAAREFTRRTYDVHTEADVVNTSSPAVIRAGGNLSFNSTGVVFNNQSEIIAGNQINATPDQIKNAPTRGEKQTITNGNQYYSYMDTHSALGIQTSSNREAKDERSYNPVEAPVAIDLSVSKVQGSYVETSPNQGKTIDSVTGGGLTQTNDNNSLTAIASGSVDASIISPATVVNDVNALTNPSPTGVNSAKNLSQLLLPSNSLFGINPDSSHYLVQTDPQFTNYNQWLSSDYMLSALGINPTYMHKRLGDGFYEQRLINEQVDGLTGYRRLDGYQNDSEQYKALMDAGVTFAKTQQLVPGIDLSPEQVARLTSDIVWLVKETVTLPNGTQQQVLVPKVYVMVRDGDVKPSGSLISANEIHMNGTGTLDNAGTIAGRHVVKIDAGNINNQGTIQGNRVNINAVQDIRLDGGTLRAVSDLSVHAGRDFIANSTTTSAQTHSKGFDASATGISRVAGLYVTGQNGTMSINADNNLTLAGTVLNSNGTANLNAKNNVDIGTVATASGDRTVFDSRNYRFENKTQEVGSQLSAKGNLTISGNTVTLKAANLNSDGGLIKVNGAQGVSVVEGRDTHDLHAHSYFEESGLLSSSSTERDFKLNTNTSSATNIGGKNVLLQSGKDIVVRGSNVVADQEVQLVAKGDVQIDAANNTQYSESEYKKTTSGLLGTGGIGFTIGTRKLTTNQDSTSNYHTGSMIGSLGGNVTIMADGNYTQTGSSLVTDPTKGNNVSVIAKNIDILAAQDNFADNFKQTYEQSGLTIALSAPVIAAAQAAQGAVASASNAGKSKNGLINAMSIVNAAYALNSLPGTLNAIGSSVNDMASSVIGSGQNASGQGDGSNGKQGGSGGQSVTVSISYGQQKSIQEQHNKGTQAAASQIKAGGNVNLIATGSDQSSIHILGSDVAGAGGTYLDATDQINIEAADETSSQRSKNKSYGYSAGVAITAGQGGTSLGVTASGNYAQGHGNGDNVNYRNSHVGSLDSQTLINSGGTTTLKGAQVLGKSVSLSAKDLNIESLQDTATYDGEQLGVQAQGTAGLGFSGFASASYSSMNSDYASVNEQSGILAGNDGYHINVANHTDLKGAIITSTQAAESAGNNSFSTGSLSSRDIQNHAKYGATSVGVGSEFSGGSSPSLGGMKLTNMNPSGRASITSTMGAGHDSDSQSSTTRSGINTKNITITNEAGQLALGSRADTIKSQVMSHVTTDNVAQSSGYLNNHFDADKVQNELDTQVAITQDFGSNMKSLSQQLYGYQLEDLNQQKEQLKDSAQLKAINDQIATLQKEQVVFNAVTGALTGGALNGVTGAVAGVAGPTGSYLIGQTFKPLEVNGQLSSLQEAAHIGSHAVLGALTAVASGGNAFVGGAAAGLAEGATPLIAQQLFGTSDPSKLTADQKSTLSSAASLLGAGAGAAAGNSDSAFAGGTAANNAVSNNDLLNADRDKLNNILKRAFDKNGKPLILDQSDYEEFVRLYSEDKGIEKLLYKFKTDREHMTPREKQIYQNFVDLRLKESPGLSYFYTDSKLYDVMSDNRADSLLKANLAVYNSSDAELNNAARPALYFLPVVGSGIMVAEGGYSIGYGSAELNNGSIKNGLFDLTSGTISVLTGIQTSRLLNNLNSLHGNGSLFNSAWAGNISKSKSSIEINTKNLSKVSDTIPNAIVSNDIIRPAVSFKENITHAKLYPGEFNRQLQAQQDAINQMSTKQFMQHMENYSSIDKVQYKKVANTARADYRRKIISDKTLQYIDNGLPIERAKAQAKLDIQDQAALHIPDTVAGGNPSAIADLGNKRVNSSIGAQWPSRLKSIYGQLKERYPNTNTIPENLKMNIDLFNSK